VSSSNRPPAAADTRRGALSIGSHKAHASCGRPCVPAFLHAEFRQNLGGDEDANDRELRAWYGRVMDEWHGKTIPLDGVKFWRRAFESWQKTEAEEAMWKAM
jgi:hypothetical protein